MVLSGHEATQAEVANLFQQIVNHAKNIPKAHLIFIGCVPNPRNDHTFKEKFVALNRKLFKISRKNRKTVTFLSVGNNFTHNGEVKIEFYKDLVDHCKREQKREIENGKIVTHPGKNTHLNFDGASMLTKMILNKMNTLPKEYFKE